MDNLDNTSELLALDDTQLDVVTGGCLPHRRHHGHRGYGPRQHHGHAGVDITINIIQIDDSTLAAGRDIVVQAG